MAITDPPIEIPSQADIDFIHRPKFPRGIRLLPNNLANLSRFERLNANLTDFNPSRKSAISNLGPLDFTARILTLEDLGQTSETEDPLSIDPSAAELAEVLVKRNSDLSAAISNFIFVASIRQDISNILNELDIYEQAVDQVVALTKFPSWDQFNLDTLLRANVSAFNTIKRSVQRSVLTADIEQEALNYAENSYDDFNIAVQLVIDDYPIADSLHGGPGGANA